MPIIILMPPRKNHGFTLIELLVVIVIVGILSSVALPSFRSFIANQRIKSASFDVMAMLTLTRSEAIKRNATATSTPTGSNWANGWTVTTAGGTVLSQQTALTGLTVTCPTSATCNSITFENNGRSGNAQSIQINSVDATADRMRCINIDLSGRPNSKKGAC